VTHKKYVIAETHEKARAINNKKKIK